MIRSLEEINKFRNWSATFPHFGGEWEIEYLEWDKIYLTIINDLKNKYFLPDFFSDLIYIIARDNECEYIIDELTNYPKIYLEIAAKSLESLEFDAQWQFAAYFPKIKKYHSQVLNTLLRFYESDNEYVKRRAIYALSEIKYPKIESLAERSWNTGIDSQRQATLEVLFECRSNKLNHYMPLAEKENGEHIKYTMEKLKKHFA